VLRRISFSLGVGSLLVLTVLPAGAYPTPVSFERVSTSCSGAQANDASGEHLSVGLKGMGRGLQITPNGRFVAFSSKATNLVSGTTTPASRVYVKDLKTGCIRLASVSDTGIVPHTLPPGAVSACGGAGDPSISADGSRVAFTSCFIDLVAGTSPTDPVDDVFVHDFRTGRTEKVSIGADGKPATGPSSSPSISADGRFVAFESSATNLTSAGTASTTVTSQVFVRDMRTHVTRLVSPSTAGSPGDGNSYRPTISGNGQRVVFTSESSNLVSNDLNVALGTSAPDVYVFDLRLNRMTLASVALDGRAPLRGNLVFPASGEAGTDISFDGRYVVFDSNAYGLVPNDGAGSAGRIFVRDLSTGRTRRVAVDSSGQNVEGGGGSLPAIDPQGRHIDFQFYPGGTCQSEVIARADLVTGEVVSVDQLHGSGDIGCDPGSHTSEDPSASATGRWVAFSSVRTDLVRGDTNRVMDVFVRDMGDDLGTGDVWIGKQPEGIVPQLPKPSGAFHAASSGQVGARLRDALVAFRPDRSMYFRVELDGWDSAPAALVKVYALSMRANGQSWEVRMAGSAGRGTFQLCRTGSGDRCQRVATLRGGWGTTGEELTFSLPLSYVGARVPGQIEQLVASSGLGTVDSGIATRIDQLTLVKTTARALG
jgi:Tol biopolymer transport system component